MSEQDNNIVAGGILFKDIVLGHVLLVPLSGPPKLGLGWTAKAGGGRGESTTREPHLGATLRTRQHHGSYLEEVGFRFACSCAASRTGGNVGEGKAFGAEHC